MRPLCPSHQFFSPCRIRTWRTDYIDGLSGDDFLAFCESSPQDRAQPHTIASVLDGTSRPASVRSTCYTAVVLAPDASHHVKDTSIAVARLKRLKQVEALTGASGTDPVPHS